MLLRKEIGALIELAWPIVCVQIGMMSLGVVDTIMAGALGADATASVGLAMAWRIAALIIAQGVAAGMTPLIAHAWARRNLADLSESFIHGLALLGVLQFPIMLWYFLAGEGLRRLGQPAALIPETSAFCHTLIYSIPGFLGFYLFQGVLQGIGRVKPVLGVIIFANGVNALMNWLLMYGKFGFPELGVQGIAWSAVITSVAMFMTILMTAIPLLKHFPPMKIHKAIFLKVSRLTLPVGLQWALEICVFHAALLMAGNLGTDVLAAHVIIQNLASLVFIIPLGFSVAVAIRVAHHCAAHHSWVLTSQIAIVFACALVLIPSLLFVLCPLPLGGIYSHSKSVLKLIAVVLPIAGVMQIFDAIQVTLLGILRGIGDVLMPSFIHPLGLWCLGLPFAVWLSHYLKMGLAGLWLGLTLGIVCVVIALLLRLVRHYRGYAFDFVRA